MRGAARVDAPAAGRISRASAVGEACAPDEPRSGQGRQGQSGSAAGGGARPGHSGAATRSCATALRTATARGARGHLA
eukprot:8317975-Pyramimonas_sp.AAC.1